MSIWRLLAALDKMPASISPRPHDDNLPARLVLNRHHKLLPCCLLSNVLPLDLVRPISLSPAHTGLVCSMLALAMEACFGGVILRAAGPFLHLRARLADFSPS